MTDTWEKKTKTDDLSKNKRSAYLVVGIVLIGAVIFLIYNAMAAGTYYMTIDELVNNPDKYIDKKVRVGGAVIDTDENPITFDPQKQTLTFLIAHIPNDDEEIRAAGGLGEVLHNAVNNPDAKRIQVVWQDAEMPDLLQHEAQAIITGHLDSERVFHAEEVLLKCPTRYSDDTSRRK